MDSNHSSYRISNSGVKTTLFSHLEFLDRGDRIFKKPNRLCLFDEELVLNVHLLDAYAVIGLAARLLGVEPLHQ